MKREITREDGENCGGVGELEMPLKGAIQQFSNSAILVGVSSMVIALCVREAPNMCNGNVLKNAILVIFEAP